MEKEFLQIALDDLAISKYSFQSKKYRNAVSHLQQANEKLFKGFQIASGISDLKSLKRRAGHDPSITLFDWVKAEISQWRKDIELVKEKHQLKDSDLMSPQIQSMLEKLENDVNIAQQNNKLPVDLASEEEFISGEIDKLIVLLKSDYSSIWKLTITKPSNLVEHMPFLKSFPQLLEQLDKTLIEDQKNLQEWLKVFIVLLRFIAICFVITTTLNVILTPHFNTARYPTDDKQKHYVYDEKHPLIVHYIELYCLLNLALKNLSNLIIFNDLLKNEDPGQ